MAELDIEIVVPARAATAMLAGALLFGAASELASENIIMTTYNPSPSGVYANLLTTGQTYLAMTARGVTIGGTGGVENPPLITPQPPSGRLAVMNGSLSIGTLSPSAALHVDGQQTFGDVTVNRMRGIGWNGGNFDHPTGYYYGFNREPGNWDGTAMPDGYPYPDLKLEFHTGLKLKGNGGYGGVSIYEDYCDTGVDNCASTSSGSGSELARFRTNYYGGSYVLSKLGVGYTTPGAPPVAAGPLDVMGDGVGVFRQPAAQCWVPLPAGGCPSGSYQTTAAGVQGRAPTGMWSPLCCSCGGTCPTIP